MMGSHEVPNSHISVPQESIQAKSKLPKVEIKTTVYGCHYLSLSYQKPQLIIGFVWLTLNTKMLIHLITEYNGGIR